MQLMCEVLGEETRGVAFGQLYKKITQTCKFFPSPAEILEIAGLKKKTARELATDFVDEALHLLIYEPKEAYAKLGAEGYRYAKHIGMDPYGLKAGTIKPEFKRGEWIDRAERDYKVQMGEELPVLEASKAEGFLKVIEGKMKNEDEPKALGIAKTNEDTPGVV